MARRFGAALLLLTAALLRCPRGWKLMLESTDGGGRYVVWYSGETLGEAVLRFAWLLVAKWLALRKAALSVEPLQGARQGNCVDFVRVHSLIGGDLFIH